jgi:hypothetical protein
MQNWSLTLEMRRSGRIALIIGMISVLPISLLELGHLVRFGHFFPFGLHADVVVRKADYGIDGVTKAYEAKLTNYGITPAWITACDFVDDVMSHGTLVRATVEKWDGSARKWENIFKGDTSAFCRPYPTGMIETHVISKRLWPGQSISTGEEATAARNVFAIGDTARFRVFAGETRAFPTAAFSIDEHPTMSDVPYRFRH